MPTSSLGLRYPALADAPNIPQDLGNLVTDIGTLLNSGFTSYTPAWTAGTSNPSIGNGTITGAYRRTGTWVLGFISVTAGTTTTFGSGEYFWSIPSGLIGVVRSASHGIAALRDASATVHYLGAINLSTSLLVQCRMHGVAELAQGTPITLATSDTIRIMYEIEVNPA